MDTNASTNFDATTIRKSSVDGDSVSEVSAAEQQQVQAKKPASKTAEALAKRANMLVRENMISEAERKVLLARKQSKQELRAIRQCLIGMKTVKR